MPAVYICVSLSKRDLNIIDNYCKQTSKVRSRFLVQSAISEIKNGNDSDIKPVISLWTKIVGR